MEQPEITRAQVLELQELAKAPPSDDALITLSPDTVLQLCDGWLGLQDEYGYS